MKFLILDYIKQINHEDIKNFGISNNIYLDESEINNLYGLLKDKNILNYNDSEYELILKKNISQKNYLKVKNLFFEYKKKYQNYL